MKSKPKLKKPVKIKSVKAWMVKYNDDFAKIYFNSTKKEITQELGFQRTLVEIIPVIITPIDK